MNNEITWTQEGEHHTPGPIVRRDMDSRHEYVEIFLLERFWQKEKREC